MLTNDPPTDAQLDELRSEHGDIVEVEAEGLHVVLAKPPKANRAAVCQRFTEQAADAKQRLVATTALFKACCVYPSKDEVVAMLAEEPLLPNSFAEHLMSMLGVRETSVKKG